MCAGNKIAVEYDEIYWHKNKKDQDKTRVEYLIKNNWKVITIRACKNIPTIDQLNLSINNIISGKTNWSIIELEGWK